MRTRWVIGALIVIAPMAGCGDIFGPPDDKVTVVNAMQDTVAFTMWDLESSNLIDPNPFPIPRAEFNGRVVAQGRSARVPVSEIFGYRRNADLRIFTWRVRRDTLTYGPTVTWTAADQRRSGYRVGLEDLVMIAR
ncbi:MAG: hypothetical protein H7099_07940 [Gemmatimonadaceae bacterium]|nr:hypothetical protein [Gemmatimonadaceae bacterium]